MQLDIEADTKRVQQEIRAIGNQAPFALALGITRTVQEGQREMQARMPRVFNLRGTEALFRKSVRVTTATKTTQEGSVRISALEGGKGPNERVSQIILRHEDGGTKSSASLYRLRDGSMKPLGFYLPGKGLRSDVANVPRKLYPRNIGIASRRAVDGTSTFANARKGRKVTRGAEQRELSYFATARGGVYERRVFGSGSAVRLLWWLRPQVRLRARLGFFDTIERVIDERYRPNILEAIDRAIASAAAAP